MTSCIPIRILLARTIAFYDTDFALGFVLHRHDGDLASARTASRYLARRESARYTLMRFRLIKIGVAHVYDVYTV